MKVRYDYSFELKQGHLDGVIDVLRKGQISRLNHEELNLIADYLEGKLKKNQANPYKYEEAKILLGECSLLTTYGCTSDELSQKIQSLLETGLSPEEATKTLKCNHMTKEKAYLELTKKPILGRYLGYEQIKKIVLLGNAIDESEHEEHEN